MKHFTLHQCLDWEEVLRGMEWEWFTEREGVDLLLCLDDGSFEVIFFDVELLEIMSIKVNSIMIQNK